MTTQSTAPTVHASHRVLAVHPDTDVITALRVMGDNGVRHLPVVSGHRCQGIVIEADLLRAVATTTGTRLPTAGALCHRRPPTVPEGAELSAVAAAIFDGGIDAALVVHGGALIGIVTSTDVLAAVANR